MPAKYFTILTNIGSALHANAQIQQTKVPWTHMALGDGGGVEIQPTQTQTGLVREVHRLPITAIDPHPTNPNWIVVEAVLPNNVGGWTVRETAIIGGTNSAQCIAVGNYPASYKPVLADGAVREMVMRMIVEISSTATVNLVIDPAVAIASRGWVEGLTSNTERRGIVELANDAEVSWGQDDQRAITPKALRSVLPRTAFILGEGASINDLGLTGLYYLSGGANGPAHPTPFNGWIRHSSVNVGVYAYQEAFDVGSQFWRRVQNNGVWGAWTLVQSKTDIDQIVIDIGQSISQKEAAIAAGDVNDYWAGDKKWKSAADIPVRNATELKTGVAEIATQVETDTGTDDARFVTPKKLSAFALKDPSSVARGMPFCATDAEVAAGANQVKVVTPYLLRGVGGIGQSWQDVTASRALGITYTNTGQKPILVTVRGITNSATSRAYLYATANGLESMKVMETAPNEGLALAFWVTPGQTYHVAAVEAAMTNWREYR